MRQLDLFHPEQDDEMYPTAEPLTALSSGRGETFVNVQRQFEKNGFFHFTGSSKIGSPRDVAYIFRCLETAAMENAFAVLMKEERPIIVHLGMGSSSSTTVALEALIAADVKIHPDKVYFVHNHPSGALIPSLQDKETWRRQQQYFGDRLQPGIIINTRSGKFITFDENGQIGVPELRPKGVDHENKLETYSFSKQVFSKDYVESESLTDVSKVAAFLSGQRLGERKKFSYLVVGNDLSVKANIHTHYSTISANDIDTIARKMVQDVAVFGGARVIGYGSVNIDSLRLQQLTNRTKALSGNEQVLLDYVHIQLVVDLMAAETQVQYEYQSWTAPGMSTVLTVDKKAEKTKSDSNLEPEQIQTESPDKQHLDYIEPSSTAERKIKDFGEYISGAKKDLLRDIARRLENVTEKSLIELPLSKQWKRPDLKKLVEEGLITEEDARIAEAVIQFVILRPKPKLTKKEERLARYRGTKTNVEQWAAAVHEGITILRDILLLPPEGRKARIREITQDDYPFHAYLKKEYAGLTSPNPIRILDSVLLAVAYKPGERVEIPRVNVRKTQNGTMEILKQDGSVDYKVGSAANEEEAVRKLIQITKLQRGDKDVSFVESDFYIRGMDAVFIPEERYTVNFLTGRSFSPKTSIFTSETEARDFMTQIEKRGGVGKMVQEKKFDHYESFAIIYTNPIDGNTVVLPNKYPSVDAVRQALKTDLGKIQMETRQLLGLGTDKQEAGTEEVKPVFSVYRKHAGFRVGIDKKHSPTGQVYLVGPEFKVYQDAVDWMNANQEALYREFEKYKAQIKKIVYFQTDAAERKGPDYRQGKDVTPEMFSSVFGFRGVQFGNWTNDKDRQAALNSTYDALMDLSDVVGKKPQALSLNGELGLAFGSRGSGSANAHYEPHMVIINLTKTRGAGSLAHEWWHALDNYFSRHSNVPLGFLTTSKDMANTRPEVYASFKKLVSEIKNSEYGKRSEKSGAYWGDPIEMTARLFAEWVDKRLADNDRKNHFLSRGLDPEISSVVQKINYELCTMLNDPDSVIPYDEFVKQPESLMGLPYPVRKEVADFEVSLDQVFQTIQERVDGQNGKTLLFRDDENDENLEAVNEKFNQELQRQIDGTLPKDHIYHIGMPGDFLKAAGIPNLPIQLLASRLAEKSSSGKHDYDLDKVQNLPRALAKPIATFSYGNRNKAQNILTVLEDDGRNFIVGLFIRPMIEGDGRVLEVNSIRNLFPKNTISIIHWINQGKLTNADKKRLLHFLDQQRTNHADVAFVLPAKQVKQENAEVSLATKIVENFKNPTLETEKIEQSRVNERFNAELERQVADKLPKNHVYELGMPSAALLEAGMPNLPIELSAERLARKSSDDYTNQHPFKLENVKNLPEALAHPIAVFDARRKNGAKVVLTELIDKNHHFVVAIQVRKSDEKKIRIEINSIRSLYPKDRVQGILEWISRGLMVWVDKEKALKFLSTQWPNYIAGGNESESLSLSAKIVENFKNPTLQQGEICSTVENLSDILHTPIRIVRMDEIQHQDMDTERRMRGAKGWYDVSRDQVVIVLDNIKDEEDAKKTVLHEVVGHKGLRKTLGNKAFGVFCESVFASMSEKTRQTYLAKYGDPQVAGEEFVARLAEQDAPDSIWSRITSSLKVALNSIGVRVNYSTKEVRSLLRRSYRKIALVSVESKAQFKTNPKYKKKVMSPKGMTL